MLRKNLMSALIAAAATGAVLTGYNAFLHKNVSVEKSATTKLSSYLHLDKSKQETTADENNVVGTDNNQTASNTTSTTATPTTDSSPAASSSSATATTQESAATPTTTTTAVAAVAKPQTTYVVKEGDTYGCIAEKYYGSFEHFSDVMHANPVSDQGFGEYSLYVGAQLVLPAVAKSDLKPASTLCQ